MADTTVDTAPINDHVMSVIVDDQLSNQTKNPAHSIITEPNRANQPITNQPILAEQVTNTDFIAIGAVKESLLIQQKEQNFNVLHPDGTMTSLPAAFSGNLLQFSSANNSPYATILTRNDHGYTSGVYDDNSRTTYTAESLLNKNLITLLQNHRPTHQSNHAKQQHKDIAAAPGMVDTMETPSVIVKAVSGHGDVIFLFSKTGTLIYGAGLLNGSNHFYELPRMINTSMGSMRLLFSPSCLSYDGNVAAGSAVLVSNSGRSIRHLMAVSGLRSGKRQIRFVSEVADMQHLAVRCFASSSTNGRSKPTQYSNFSDTTIYALVRPESNAKYNDRTESSNWKKIAWHHTEYAGNSGNEPLILLVSQGTNTPQFYPYLPVESPVSKRVLFTVEPRARSYIYRAPNGTVQLRWLNGKEKDIPPNTTVVTESAVDPTQFQVYFNTPDGVQRLTLSTKD